MRNFKMFGLFLLLSVGLFAACSEDKTAKVVDFEKTAPVAPLAASGKTNAVRIAVGGMITPKEGYGYYQRFLKYIEKKVGRPVEFVDRENYAEINKLVKEGQIDVAFVCGGPYVDGHADFGMELLVAPRAYGDQVYYSYIIVAKDSPIQSLADLRGKTFAFTDPLSNTGTLVPTYLLAKMGETPEHFFKKTFFSQSHDKSIKAVAQGVADGAAVDSLIWEYAARVNPEFTAKTKIINKSAPYGIPPVVVRSGLDPVLKERLRQVFTEAHLDKEGAEILQGMMTEQYLPIADSAYDSIREMKSWIAAQKNKPATGK